MRAEHGDSNEPATASSQAPLAPKAGDALESRERRNEAVLVPVRNGEGIIYLTTPEH